MQSMSKFFNHGIRRSRTVTRVLTAHVPLELAAKVDAAAAQHDRSRAWIIKQALTAWLDPEERPGQIPLEGLTNIEAGRAVDHEAG